MENGETKERPEALELALTRMRQKSEIAELRRKLLLEEAAVENASKALTAILTGELTDDIHLDQDASGKLLGALRPEDVPGLVVSEKWRNVTDSGSRYNDGSWSGSKLTEIVFNEKASYLLQQVTRQDVISVVVTSQAAQKPESNI